LGTLGARGGSPVGSAPCCDDGEDRFRNRQRGQPVLRSPARRSARRPAHSPASARTVATTDHLPRGTP